MENSTFDCKPSTAYLCSFAVLPILDPGVGSGGWASGAGPEIVIVRPIIGGTVGVNVVVAVSEGVVVIPIGQKLGFELEVNLSSVGWHQRGNDIRVASRVGVERIVPIVHLVAFQRCTDGGDFSCGPAAGTLFLHKSCSGEDERCQDRDNGDDDKKLYQGKAVVSVVFLYGDFK